MAPKRSWPLVALAATSFIPGFGFLLGAVAVTWGLLSDRPRARLAVALGATGALLQVLGGIVFLGGFQGSPTIRRAQITVTAADLVRLVSALDEYRAAHGDYPPTLEDLVGRPIPLRFLNIHDQTAGILRLRVYEYRLAADGRTFDLFSVGPDGVAGTADDIRPALPDSVATHSGYKPSR